ncbi:MAG: peptide-methionine (S)-S-oxide reductase [Bacteroidetes bacterium MedPE-SWsnd-G2]|nr:MAG: peptide-methionine (S)-S-oxide reductase [Bacteroidetes bacterium MedPE-SWsnd-G2]
MNLLTKQLALSLSLALLFSCQQNAQNLNDKQQSVISAEPIQVPLENGLAKAYFASGCFWCVEAIYESVNGVTEAISGYSGGFTEKPTYEKSNTGRTGHAEAVEVIYDPNIVSFATLVDVYFGSQNPLQVNGQGPDNGSQYRSIVFFQNAEEKKIIESKKSELSKQLGKPVAAEVYPFQKFWIAEDYHQNYERLHPNQSYIKAISVPRLNRFKRKFPELIKSNH